MRPRGQRQIGIRCRLNDACGYERIVPFGASAMAVGDQFGDHPAVGGDCDTLASLDLPHIVAEIVLEIADACLDHSHKYSHMWLLRQGALTLVGGSRISDGIRARRRGGQSGERISGAA